jgi:hypothetical protein
MFNEMPTKGRGRRVCLASQRNARWRLVSGGQGVNQT